MVETPEQTKGTGFSRRQYLSAVAASGVGIAGVASGAGTAQAASVEPDRAVLDEPFIDEKLMIAHYMPGMVPARKGEDFWMDPTYYDPHGPTGQLGGAMLHATVPALLHQSSDLYGHQPVDLPLNEAVRLELETAKRFATDSSSTIRGLGTDR